MGFFKKIGRGIKKFARSKVGKIVGVVGGTALAAAGVGKGLKLLKGLRKAKGIGSKVRRGLKVGKGIFGKSSDQQSKDVMLRGGVSRLSRRLARKVARKQRRLDRKQAKALAKQAGLDTSLDYARQALGSSEFSQEAKDMAKAELDQGLEKFASNFKDEDEDADPSGVSDEGGIEVVDKKKDMIKTVAIVGGSGAALFALGKLTGIIK